MFKKHKVLEKSLKKYNMKVTYIMIKCIAIDMDGTLLTPTHQVTDKNKEAIKQAQSLGVEVVIATGRSYQEATFALDEAGIQCPIICVNGAEIRSEKGQILSSNPLDKETARNVANFLSQNEIYYELYTNQGTFSTDLEKAVSIMIDITMSANPEENFELVSAGARQRVEKGLVHKVDHYETLINDENHEIYKLLAFSFDQDRLTSVQETLKETKGLVVTSSGYENLELSSVHAQKGIALEAFVNERNISLADTMAIGDNYNDLSMFQKVGRSVAMGNASDEIKKECSHVTLTNEESGVGEAILQAIRE